MKMIKCDRCGEVNEVGNTFILHKNSTVKSDEILCEDLCEKCEKELYKFFKPVKSESNEKVYNKETNNSKELVSFNLNCEVVVYLDEKGKDILKKYYETNDITHWESEDKPGYYTLNMCNFIDIFGRRGSGSYSPYSCEVFLYKKDIGRPEKER